MSERYFLGFETKARDGWERFFAEPRATRSSKPESVKKEIEDKRVKQAAKAPFMAIAGTVTRAVLLDTQGQQVFEGADEVDAGSVSASLFNVLEELLPSGKLLSDGSQSEDVNVRLFGLHIRDRLHLAALDALHYLSKSSNKKPPIGFWYHRPFEPSPWLDPYEACVPSAQRDDVDVYGLCDFLSIDIPVDLSTDALAQAQVALQITAAKAQMFPVAIPA